jgi:ketosteroid isomerase-like protein
VVLASGDLAHSTGPVARPDGTVGRRFYSTWRRERDGAWRVVFDDGYLLCPKPAA